jgi:hypothetical protein
MDRFFGNPFDPMITPNRSCRRAWMHPSELIQDRANELKLTLETGSERTVIYLDAGIHRRASVWRVIGSRSESGRCP